MSIIAQVKDGKVVDSSVSTVADSASTREVNNSMDKDAFLQLLVAQMQYQDPLEPTSNTEYVAQLATFSELEAMTNLNESMSISRASELVGKTVTVQATSATTGEVTEAIGVVDYVLVENNKAYLVIDGDPYSIDDLSGIMTEDYWNIYQDMVGDQTSETAQKVMAAIAQLPEEVTLEHADYVAAVRKAYTELSADEKNQVTNDALYKLIQAEHTIAKLTAEKERNDAANGTGSADGADSDNEDNADTDDTNGTDQTEGSGNA